MYEMSYTRCYELQEFYMMYFVLRAKYLIYFNEIQWNSSFISLFGRAVRGRELPEARHQRGGGEVQGRHLQAAFADLEVF